MTGFVTPPQDGVFRIPEYIEYEGKRYDIEEFSDKYSIIKAINELIIPPSIKRFRLIRGSLAKLTIEDSDEELKAMYTINSGDYYYEEIGCLGAGKINTVYLGRSGGYSMNGTYTDYRAGSDRYYYNPNLFEIGPKATRVNICQVNSMDNYDPVYKPKIHILPSKNKHTLGLTKGAWDTKWPEVLIEGETDTINFRNIGTLILADNLINIPTIHYNYSNIDTVYIGNNIGYLSNNNDTYENLTSLCRVYIPTHYFNNEYTNIIFENDSPYNLSYENGCIYDSKKEILYGGMLEDPKKRNIDTERFPASVRQIAKNAFKYKYRPDIYFDKLILPEKIEEIGDSAFLGCKFKAICTSAKKIGAHAFHYDLESGLTCDKLFTLDLNNSKEIGEYAFYGHNSISHIELGEDIESVGDYAFSSPTMLHQRKILITKHGAVNFGKIYPEDIYNPSSEPCSDTENREMSLAPCAFYIHKNECLAEYERMNSDILNYPIYDISEYTTLEQDIAREEEERQAGVENVTDDDTTLPIEYYNLQGIRVETPAPGNIYILKQGSRVSKVKI